MPLQPQQKQKQYREREAARRRHAKTIDDALSLLWEARRTARGDREKLARAVDEALATWDESAQNLMQADALPQRHR